MISTFLSLVAASLSIWPAFAGSTQDHLFSFGYAPLGKVLDAPGDFRVAAMHQAPMVLSSDASTLAVFGMYPRSTAWQVRILSLKDEQPRWIESELDNIKLNEAVSFSRENDLVAIVESNGITFWNIRDGKRRQDLKALSCPAHVVDASGPFDRDRPFKPFFFDGGKKILANCGYRWSAVWEVQSGKILSAFIGDGDSLNPQRAATKAPVLIHPNQKAWSKAPFPNVENVPTSPSDLKVYLHSDIAKIVTSLTHQDITVLDTVLSDDGNEVGVTYVLGGNWNSEHKVGLLRLAQQAWAPVKDRAEVALVRYVKTSPEYEKQESGEYYLVTTEGTSSNLRYSEVGSYLLFEHDIWHQSIPIYSRNFGSSFGQLNTFYLDPELRWVLFGRKDGTVEVVDRYQLNKLGNTARGIFRSYVNSCVSPANTYNSSGIKAIAVDLKNRVVAVADDTAYSNDTNCAPIRIIRLGL